MDNNKNNENVNNDDSSLKSLLQKVIDGTATEEEKKTVLNLAFNDRAKPEAEPLTDAFGGVYNSDLMFDGMLFSTKYDLQEYLKYKEQFKHSCIVDVNGKPAFVTKKKLKDGTIHEKFMTFQNAKDFYLQEHFNVVDLSKGLPKKTTKHFFPMWLMDKSTKKYDRIVFEPNSEKVEDSDYNLWEGYIEPKAGSIKPFMRYVKNLIVGTKQDRKHLIQLLAWTVQNPGKIAENCIAVRGPQGVGKTSLGMHVKAICPRHTKTFKNFDFMTGWNDHTKEVKYFLMEESVWGGEVSKEGVIKDFLTGGTREINTKYFSAYTIPNYSFCIFTSNEDWLAPVGKGDRRFNVFDCRDAKKGDHEYWNKYYEWLYGEGKHYIMHLLLNLDLSKFKIKETVMNEAKADTQALSFRGIDKFIHALLSNDLELFEADGTHIDLSPWDDGEFKIDKHLIITAVNALLGKNSISPHAVSSGLNKIFKFEDNWKTRWKRSNGMYFYKLPSKRECMELFSKHVEIPIDKLFTDCTVAAPKPKEEQPNQVHAQVKLEAPQKPLRAPVATSVKPTTAKTPEPVKEPMSHTSWTLDGKEYHLKFAYDKALKDKGIEQPQPSFGAGPRMDELLAVLRNESSTEDERSQAQEEILSIAYEKHSFG
jgi:hypothetical protein